MNRQHLPRAPRGPSQSFLPPRPDSHFGSHPSLISQKIIPFFSYIYELHISQSLCFDIQTKCRGGVPPRGLECLSLAPYPLLVPRKTEGSPLFSHSCALFCILLHSRKPQLFSFQAIPHSLAKTPGVGEGRAFVLPENSSKNATAPASGEKKEMGQARKPVPQILDGLALGREPVLSEQMHWHFAQVPDDAEPGEDLQRVIGDVNLPPEETLARRSHAVMMVVVPAFAERQQRVQQVGLA